VAKLKKSKKESGEVTMDRRTGQDRRDETDRRQEDTEVDSERRQSPRRAVARRRQIDPTTCERDYTPDEIEFMQAMDAYKRSSGRMFPTCSEVLEVIRGLGYEKLTEGVTATAEPSLAEEMTETTDDFDNLGSELLLDRELSTYDELA
jgi:hypothetical protein